MSLPQISPDAGAAAYLAEAVELAGAVPEGAADPAQIRRVGILGSGAMGRGIAMAFAQTGRNVVLVDPSAEALATAIKHLEGLADRQLAKGKLDADGRDALLARFSTGEQISAFAGCDLVVEAVPEEMALKQSVMRQIEEVVAADALITSNTSTLDVDAIAGAMPQPQRFCGTHFFMPAQVNKLLEVVPAQQSSADTLSAVLALARDLGKQAVVAANGDGFIGNRLFDRFHQEAMYLVEEGADPKAIDSALEEWGFTIGPFRTLDIIGNDIPWGVRKQRAERDSPPPQPRVGDALCEAGLYGLKTGRGWYLYDEATPKGRPYEEAQALILQISRALGRERRRISADEIVGRCVIALIVEGMAMLLEDRAARASDIDMVYVTGYGFPAAVGGPMRLGEKLGFDNVLELARGYAELSDRADTAWHLAGELSAAGFG
jgi:3-hydroxyacyl-CoA dehydrogenase